jgi:hypothetical protein
MALLTWLHPIRVQLDGSSVLFSRDRDMGVVYTITFLLLLLVTNVKVRGVVSVAVILFLAFLTVLFAYLHWWESLMRWLGNLPIYMDLGFYLIFSTVTFASWVLSVFVFDHLSFWRVRSGQVTHEYVLGAVDRSYDTDNLVLTKRQDDVFRHWLLGLGSGDLHMQTMGGLGPETDAPNVLFVGAKVARIQRLIAAKPPLAEEA